METTNKNLLGVGSLVLAILIFSLQDIAVKWMGGSYPILEIVIFRTLVAIPATLFFFRMEGGQGLPTTQRYKLEFLRGAIYFISYTTYLMGLAALPLAEIAAIKFSTPLMLTLFSVILLGEKVKFGHWIALIVGFLGVLIIIRPGSASFNLGSVFILLTVLTYVFAALITRRLQTTDSSATMSYYGSLVYMLIAVILAPIVIAIGPIPNANPSIVFLFRAWSMPTLVDLLIMFGLGLVWAGGMFFTARAYSLTQASVVAPFEYASLPISTMWGFLLWHQFPPLATWIGALVTLVSSLYTLYGDKLESTPGIIELE
jgi:drug/metabolite transporter (DMT)-like permease